MLMSWDIFTFIKPRGAKGQVLSCREEFEKSVPQNFESIVSHTKCRKSKSATTRIVIEKVWKRKRFPDQVGWVGFWQKKCLASNRSWEGESERRQRVALCSLAGEERKGVVPNSIIGSCCSTRLRLSSYTQILPTAPLSLKYEDRKIFFFGLLDTFSMFNWNNAL